MTHDPSGKLEPTARSHLVVRLLLAVLLLTAASYSALGQKPWKQSLVIAESEFGTPDLAACMSAGFWYAAAAWSAVLVFLLATSHWWLKNARERDLPGPGRIQDGSPQVPLPVSRRSLIALVALIVAAGAVRLPRMTQSFWGDEGIAFARYVHGRSKPADRVTKDAQGPVKHSPLAWSQSVFGGQEGFNNHVLFTILSRGTLNFWQRHFARRQVWEFREWVVRLVPLLAGLGSIAALWCLARRSLGECSAWIAALLLALHPWHLRYSTEARGYSLMILFLILAVDFALRALSSGAWRHWLAFGAMEFLAMYSVQSSLYPLAALNLALLVGAPNATARWRLVVVNLLAALPFTALCAPVQLQAQMAVKRLAWLTGRTLEEGWQLDLMSETAFGFPWSGDEAGSPVRVTMQRLMSQTSPIILVLVITLLAACLVLGIVTCWRRDRRLCLVLLAPLLGAPLLLLHFTVVLKSELRPWYWVFTMPFLALFTARGAVALASSVVSPWGGRWRRVASCSLPLLAPAAFAWLVFPMIRNLLRFPVENFRGAFEVSRGATEPRGYDKGSKILTCYLWRYTTVYDSRADTHVRDAASLRAKMEQARMTQSSLFMVIGYRELVQAMAGDMLALVENGSLFEQVACFPAQEPLSSLTVYRMK